MERKVGWGRGDACFWAGRAPEGSPVSRPPPAAPPRILWPRPLEQVQVGTCTGTSVPFRSSLSLRFRNELHLCLSE